MSENDWIPYAVRADLKSFYFSPVGSAAYYVVKDPVKDAYYELNEVEHFILFSLKEGLRYAEIIESMSSRFSLDLSDQQLRLYIERLGNINLVKRLFWSSGNQLLDQHQRQKSGQLRNSMLSWLSIKLPGFYPGTLLDFLSPLGTLAFNSFSLLMLSLLSMATMLVAIFNLETLSLKVPAIQELVTAEHIFLTLLAFLVVKFAHEIGHGLACRYCGHECTEIGLIFLVFMPCLYCEVSDMWTERSRWKRILVSLAGIIVEIAIALICFWVWFFIENGETANLLFSIILITTINTLFVNGNPLMRYDGYYALADFVGIRNLSASSSLNFRQFCVDFLSANSTDVEDGNPLFLRGYAIASFVYRCFIMTTIGMAIWYFFERFQLESLGKAICLLLIATAIIPFISGALSIITEMRFRMNLFRGLFCAVLLLAGLGAFSALKFNYRIWGQAEFELAKPEDVYALHDGFFDKDVLDGELVEKGQTIGVISNQEILTEEDKLTGERDEVRVRISALSVADPTTAIAAEISFLQEKLATIASRLAELELKKQNLKVVAPKSGQFIATRIEQPFQPDLQTRRLNPFENSFNGAFVQRGTVLGYIGEPATLRATFTVAESEIEMIRSGQIVKVNCSNQEFEGKVSRVQLQSDYADSEGNAASVWSQQVQERVFVIEVEFENYPELRVGSTKQVVVLCESTNLASFVLRKLDFNFWK